jgi:hypothetical protein
VPNSLPQIPLEIGIENFSKDSEGVRIRCASSSVDIVEDRAKIKDKGTTTAMKVYMRGSG